MVWTPPPLGEALSAGLGRVAERLPAMVIDTLREQ